MFDHRPVLGFVRFSFFGPTDTRLGFADRAAAFAELYHPARMAARFHLFESLCLPALRAQRDGDFRVVILTSGIMPAPWRDRLRDLTADLPQVRLRFAATSHARKELSPEIAALLGEDRTGTALLFRLDDDDAVDQDYIARLRRLGAGAEPGTHITFPRGIAAFADEENTPHLAPVRKLCTAQGLATVIGNGFTKNPFQMMHGEVWKRFPLLSDPRPTSYIRAYHAFADTSANTAKRLKQIRAEIRSEGGREGSEQDQAVLAGRLAEGFPWISHEGLSDVITGLRAVTEAAADSPAPRLEET